MNVLLVGAGWIAEVVYVPFLSLLNHIENIYILDLDFEATKQRFSQCRKVKVISKDEEVNLRYEIVCILTPNYLHYDKVLTYLNQEVKILVEKPICINSTELTNLKEHYNNGSSLVYVSAPFRYRNDIQAIKNIVSSGALGDIYRVEISWLKRRGTPGAVWFTQKKLSGGGVLIDMGPHLLDLFYWLFGKRTVKHYLGSISSLFLNCGDAYADWHRTKETSSKSDVEDSSFSLLVYDDMSLSLNLVWASNIENDYAQFKIFGTKSTLDVLTSIGFSTNTLYKDTEIKLNSGSAAEVQILKIEDRKEPFRKMLFALTSFNNPDLPNAELSLHVMDNIFNIYNHSLLIG